VYSLALYEAIARLASYTKKFSPPYLVGDNNYNGGSMRRRTLPGSMVVAALISGCGDVPERADARAVSALTNDKLISPTDSTENRPFFLPTVMPPRSATESLQ
jgi:hypothetical protein